MTKIQRLAYGLISIVIKYHDSQNVEEKAIDAFAKKSNLERKSAEEQLFKDIFLLSPIELKEVLTNLINSCTTNYQERKDYLNFILDTIINLKDCCSRQEAFTSETLDSIENQLKQLFQDFILLLKSNKGTPCKVHRLSLCSLSKEHQNFSTLTGLLDYGGFYFTRSGNFLNTEVMQVFKITTNAHDEDIAATAKLMCLELQTPHLIKLIELQKNEIKKLKERVQFIENSHEDHLQHYEKLKIDNANLKKQQEEYKTQLVSKSQENDSLRDQLNALQEQLEDSRETNKKMKEKFTFNFASHASKMDYNNLLKQYGFNNNRNNQDQGQQESELNHLK